MASWKASAKKDFPRTKVFLSRLARSLPPFSVLQQAHEEVFEKMDCLACGNCCKTSSPVFTRTDVSRISSYLGMKPGVFENKYLTADSEGDFIPSSRPCPFLNEDNTCQVYLIRPKSCRGYPHTDVKEGWERHKLMASNTVVCPAAFKIVERVRALSGSEG
jgi:Fe-S-cluster containining protein